MSFDPLTILEGDALTRLRTIPDRSIQCCVTSPPYWGLRDYGLEHLVWDGDPNCEHSWDASENGRVTGGGPRPPDPKWPGIDRTADFAAPRYNCARCGAWLGSLGLEPTPDLYITHLVQIFREV